MATVRFSISMPATVRDRIREHAADAGLDVSTFLTIAAQAQMDQQDRVRKIFEPFEKARVEAEEQAEIDAILGRTPRNEAAA